MVMAIVLDPEDENHHADAVASRLSNLHVEQRRRKFLVAIKDAEQRGERLWLVPVVGGETAHGVGLSEPSDGRRTWPPRT